MDLLTFKIQEPWFQDIERGLKTIEGRSGPKGAFDAIVGRNITFHCESLNRSVTVNLAVVKHYNTLGEYLNSCGWMNVAPHCNTRDEAVAAYLQIQNSRGEYVFSDAVVAARGGINAMILFPAK